MSQYLLTTTIGAAVLSMYGGGYRTVIRLKSEKPERPCIVCGAMKRHNNSFCSAECCRKYREKK